jgi:hypothetical protein
MFLMTAMATATATAKYPYLANIPPSFFFLSRLSSLSVLHVVDFASLILFIWHDAFMETIS